ncbi:beta-lactamase hydrolase domain-containing protein [Bremerella alba]|uniref:Beta-lactamase hydrolase-like protein n=1 Tax=Bremerella alba TaxID=980252 RepID=A0A7V9A8V3_9BACT|nr:protein tyrosine phosphatase family protein [Bremerella alba]MBA2116812.1 Beta-lactamase hydrolase-like protein [Bremerella alba]
MSNAMKINEEVTVGPQPSKSEIQSLNERGFKSVINFRTAGEDDQPISPEQERTKVEAAGLKYVHIPVSMTAMGPELVDGFREQFPQLPKPVFAHCKSGKRAGAMVMMHIAVEEGMSGQHTLDKAEEMGFECEQKELRTFVKEYVDNHAK